MHLRSSLSPWTSHAKSDLWELVTMPGDRKGHSPLPFDSRVVHIFLRMGNGKEVLRKAQVTMQMFLSNHPRWLLFLMNSPSCLNS